MQQPSWDVDKHFEELLQDLSPELVELAREFKAFCRAGKVRTPTELARIVLLYCGLDKSLREVASTVTLLRERISDMAVLKRLKAAGPWVQAMLKQMLPSDALAAAGPQQRFVIVDASPIEGPGARGIDYLVHLSMDLLNLTFIEIFVTDKSEGETLRNFTFEPGDLVIADRMYCAPLQVFWAVDQGAEVLLRYRLNVPLYRPKDGTKLELRTLLAKQRRGTLRSIPVLMRSGSSSKEPRALLGYLHAYRMKKQEAQSARKRFDRYYQKKGKSKQPSEQARFFADWLLLFSSVPIEELSAEQALELFRFRWQVELAIKRWKSLLDLGELRSKRGGQLAKLWLHGKLLYALLLERRARASFGESWARLDAARRGTWWRVFKMMRDQVDLLITQASRWRPEAFPAALEVLLERPRRRKLHSVSIGLLELRTRLCAGPMDKFLLSTT